ncbi:MAG: M56 family metallopeptidase, partial [Terriglobales bacterium]
MSGLWSALVDPAARSLALAAVAGTVALLLRVRGGGAQLRLWTGVLVAAVAMPLAVAAMPGWRVVLPVLKAKPAAPAAVVPQLPAALVAPGGTMSVPAELPPAEATWMGEGAGGAFTEQSGRALPPSESRPQPDRRKGVLRKAAASPGGGAPWTWGEVGLGAYLAVVAGLLARMVVGEVLAGRMRRRAEAIKDDDLRRAAEALGRELKLRWTPRLLQSGALTTPATLGVWRPAVVLPRNWPQWTPEKRDAVLAHELAHVARGDPRTQRLSLLHRAVFWFSPLGWWLHRRLVALAEEASDDAVLAAGTSREGYADMLLDFLQELRTDGQRRAWEGVAMASGISAERRIERILNWKGTGIMRNKKLKSWGLALILAPLAAVAACAHPALAARAQAVAPPAPPPPVVTPG